VVSFEFPHHKSVGNSLIPMRALYFQFFFLILFEMIALNFLLAAVEEDYKS
jgi:hypothetical protein